jgi:hypothetical protein
MFWQTFWVAGMPRLRWQATETNGVDTHWLRSFRPRFADGRRRRGAVSLPTKLFVRRISFIYPRNFLDKPAGCTA